VFLVYFTIQVVSSISNIIHEIKNTVVTIFNFLRK